MNTQEQVEAFLAGSPHAVVGASQDRNKYGNKVLRAYLQNRRVVFPVNPTFDEIEGVAAFRNLALLPQAVHGVSVVTPPPVTERVVEEAADLEIKHIWMQPGAESDRAVQRAQEAGINVIWGGPCILIALGFREDA